MEYGSSTIMEQFLSFQVLAVNHNLKIGNFKLQREVKVLGSH